MSRPMELNIATLVPTSELNIATRSVQSFGTYASIFISFSDCVKTHLLGVRRGTAVAAHLLLELKLR